MKLRAIATLAAAAIGLSLSQAASAQCPVTGPPDLNTATPFTAGPVNPVNGFAEFVEDSNALALEICLAGDGATGPCFFDPVVPGNLFSEQVGFGAEGFWWLADASFVTPDGLDALVVMAAESAWVAEIPAPGEQFPFTRLRIRLDVPSVGTYTVVHPFGTHEFVVDAVGPGDEVRESFDIPFVPGQVNQGCVGPWLVSTGFPAPIAGFPGTYIGDGALRTTTTGDVFSVTGPVSGSTDQFTIRGKLWDGVFSTPVVADRASYDRPTLGLQPGQVDAFATSIATPEAAAATAVSLAGGPNLPVGDLLLAGPDTVGRFFRSEVLADAGVLPPFVEITATGASTDPTTLLMPLTDVVTITRAQYNLADQTLLVDAESSDASATPPPVLREEESGQTIAVRIVTAAPPATVTVVSEFGGKDTQPVTVVAVDIPEAVDDLATTDEDVAVDIDVLGNDIPGSGAIDPSTLAIVTGPADGTALIVAGPPVTVVYTPNADFNGLDSFTYTVEDDTGNLSNQATVTVTVNAVNDAPVAVDDTATTDQGSAVTIDVLANDTDVDGDALAVSSVTDGANGTVVNNGADLTYTPATGFFGTDSFTYTAVDPSGALSNVATVTVTVNRANQAPVANDDVATTDEDTPVTLDVLANDTDADGDTLTISLVSVIGSNGTVQINADNTLTYTPDLDFFGTDTFSYTVTDGAALSNEATVTVTVNAVNDPPVANDDAATTTQGTSVTIDVLANDTDVDGDALVVSAVTNGGNGTATNNGSDVTYTPDTGFSGTDSFTYTASDGNGGTAVATVTVTVVGAIVDVDILQFQVQTTTIVGRPVRTIRARVVMPVTSDPGQATVTVRGEQGGVPLQPPYDVGVSQDVTLTPGADAVLTFPPFTPTRRADITWTLTVQDGDPDVDQATALTRVR